jgi:hypothetical protein
VSTADLQKLLVQMIESSPLVPVSTQLPLIRHDCTPVCNFFQRDTVYICLHSNNVHVCSSQLCNRLQPGDEDQVCEITANSYPLDYVVPQQYECAQPERVKPQQETFQRKAKRARLNVQSVTGKHEAEAYTMLSHVMEPLTNKEGKSLMSVVNARDIIRVSEYLWGQCMQTSVYKAHPFRYRHKYHVLVVLYACIKGLFFNKVQLVPQIDAIRQWLPPFKTLPKRVRDLDISTFTKTNKIFLACMRELHPAA